jgi:hypothetical protein
VGQGEVAGWALLGLAGWEIASLVILQFSNLFALYYLAIQRGEAHRHVL